MIAVYVACCVCLLLLLHFLAWTYVFESKSCIFPSSFDSIYAYVLEVIVLIVPLLPFIFSASRNFAKTRQQEARRKEQREKDMRKQVLREEREVKRLEAMQKARAEMIEANRAYQATRLYSTPLVYGECDERRETGDYGLTHMVMTVTNRHCFDGIIHFLLPSEAARLLQVRKMFGSAVEAAEEQIVRHLHALHFARVPLHSPSPSPSPATIGAAAAAAAGRRRMRERGWTRYLHNLFARNAILLMGGWDAYESSSAVDLMVIDQDEDGEGLKVTWQTCEPLLHERGFHSAVYLQGQILSLSCFRGKGVGTLELYDVLSQTRTLLDIKTPLPNLCGAAVAEYEGRVFVIGGTFDENAEARYDRSNRVFCLYIDGGEADSSSSNSSSSGGVWVEQEARTIHARSNASACVFQGKLFLAGGDVDDDDSGEKGRSVEVYDSTTATWQPAGHMTRPRKHFSLFVVDEEHGGGLCAGSYSGIDVSIERRDEETGLWKLIGEPLKPAESRHGCCIVPVPKRTMQMGLGGTRRSSSSGGGEGGEGGGGKQQEQEEYDNRIHGMRFFVIGGGFRTHERKWNSFDTDTNTWLSHDQQRSLGLDPFSTTHYFNGNEYEVYQATMRTRMMPRDFAFGCVFELNVNARTSNNNNNRSSSSSRSSSSVAKRQNGARRYCCFDWSSL